MNTSAKHCSRCGHRYGLDLLFREKWSCPRCGQPSRSVRAKAPGITLLGCSLGILLAYFAPSKRFFAVGFLVLVVVWCGLIYAASGVRVEE